MGVGKEHACGVAFTRTVEITEPDPQGHCFNLDGDYFC